MKTIKASCVPFLQAFLVLTLLLASSRVASATTFVWTNALGGSWSAITNWSPNGVPGVGDTAMISSNGTYTVTVNSAQAVGNLTMNAASGAQTLNIASGGTLTNNSASTGNANAILEVSGGTLTGAGSLALSGPLNWSGGTIKNVVQCSGGTFTGSDFLDGGQIINVGTMAWNSPTILDGAGSVISNAFGATLTATGSGNFMEDEYGPPQTFYNAGQFNISASGVSAIFGDDFVNSGTTTINGGTASFLDGGTNSSMISVTASTAALQFGGGTFTNTSGSTISDTGSLIFNAGIVNLAGAVAVGVSNLFNGATANVTGNYPITTLLVVSGGTATFNGSAAITPSAMTMSGGTISGNPVTVSGSLNWSGGIIKNVVQCNGGTFSGSDFLDGGQIINVGTMAWNSPTILDGAGSVISNAIGATLTATGSGNFMESEYGPPQTFYNAGQLNVTASGISAIFGDDFVNSGTTTINAGTASFLDGGTNTSMISVTAATAALQFGGGTFTNTSGSTISDTGSLIFNAGTVNLAGAVTVGVSNLFNGATANVTGNYPITTLLVVSGGTVTFNGSAAITPSAMILSGGTISSNNVTVSGSLTWSGGTIKNMVQCNGGTFSGSDFLDGGQIINVGAMTWNSPTILDGVGSVISNAAGATINATGSGSFMENEYGPPQNFYNAGQFNISASGTPVTISDAFHNSGTTTLNSGTFTAQSGATNTGTISINGGTLDLNSAHSLTGGTINFGINALNNYGSNILAGTSALAGTLTSTFNGSYLPSVGNTYNIMTYGSSTGSFTKTNLLPLAVWQVNQNSTALSITVLKLVPQVSWTAPSAIVYGTALSSAQLDATATWNGSAVPGTFTYNPPSGTVLSSGSNQTLSVAFTPSDTSTYTNVTTNVLITVQEAPLTVTASNLFKTYGQTLSFAGTEFSAGGLVNGDTATSATISSPGAVPTASVAGSPYVITINNAAGTAGLTNYIITYDNGTLTVNRASLVITADNTNKIFGQTVTFAGTEFTSSGLQNGETIGSVTLTSAGAVATAAVGSYNIVPSAPIGGTFSQGNYTDAFNDGTLTVFGEPSLTLTLTLNGTRDVVTFPTVIDETYQLLSSTNLQSSWLNSGSPIAGTGASVSITNMVTLQPAFYWLQIHH